MRVADLQAALRQVDRSAVLVSTQVLERVIRHDRGLRGYFFRMPHARYFITDLKTLSEYADPADLGVEEGTPPGAPLVTYAYLMLMC